MYGWLVAASLAIVVLGCTQLPHIWREVPEVELELGWWLPDTGLSTPAAVETRVRERNVRQWLEVVLGIAREADEVPRVAPGGVIPGPSPMIWDRDSREVIVPLSSATHEFLARHRIGFPPTA